MNAGRRCQAMQKREFPTMFIVIFEVQPFPERWDDYVGTAALLRPELEQIEGFIDNDRFRNDANAGKILSLSTWRDEKSLIRWRTHGKHYQAGQVRGREEIFSDYRLRVGEIVADTALPEGGVLTGQRFDQTEVDAAKAVTITTLGATSYDQGDGTPLALESWTHLNAPAHRIAVASWRSLEECPPVASRSPLRQRTVRVIRSYSMRDRREAPQWFPDIA
jgi:heme-degrading monooxygenase HmoA